MNEIPVYLFTGFLEAGKTTFIQDTLSDAQFNEGDRILLICCEEGETPYDLSPGYMKNVSLVTLDSPEDLKNSLLREWSKTYRPQKVMVEYNGVWTLDILYGALPREWVIAQNFCFVYAPTFLSYNANMRQLVSDKLYSCDLVVFNRFSENLSKKKFHTTVRGLSRRSDIAYEYGDGHVEYDDIEDPLPFDIQAPVVTVEDRDYALWYRDLSEEPDKYDGKTVAFKAQVAMPRGNPPGFFVLGRHVMTCCVQDIQFAGLAASCEDGAMPKNEQWVYVRAKIKVRAHPIYNRPGPVLTVLSMVQAVPPGELVATFY